MAATDFSKFAGGTLDLAIDDDQGGRSLLVVGGQWETQSLIELILFARERARAPVKVCSFAREKPFSVGVKYTDHLIFPSNIVNLAEKSHLTAAEQAMEWLDRGDTLIHLAREGKPFFFQAVDILQPRDLISRPLDVIIAPSGDNTFHAWGEIKDLNAASKSMSVGLISVVVFAASADVEKVKAETEKFHQAGAKLIVLKKAPHSISFEDIPTLTPETYIEKAKDGSGRFVAPRRVAALKQWYVDLMDDLVRFELAPPPHPDAPPLIPATGW